MNLTRSLIAFGFALLFPAMAPTQTAPVPVQITTAKTVFVANAGAGADSDGQRFYNVVYADLKLWNHYELTATPAGAELAIEVSYEQWNRDSLGGTGLLHLTIRDIKTNIVLWVLSEFSGDINNIDAPAAGAVNNLKTLASGSQVDFTPPAKKKK